MWACFPRKVRDHSQFFHLVWNPHHKYLILSSTAHGSPSWLLPPLPKTQPLPPWLPLGPHLNLTFTSHYSLAHWLVLTSTPPSLGSSPPYLKPNPSLPGYLSALSSLPHTYILYPFYCFSPPRAAPMLIIFLPLTLTGHTPVPLPSLVSHIPGMERKDGRWLMSRPMLSASVAFVSAEGWCCHSVFRVPPSASWAVVCRPAHPLPFPQIGRAHV